MSESANILEAGATTVVIIRTIMTVRPWHPCTKLVDRNFSPVNSYDRTGTLKISFTVNDTATSAETQDRKVTTPLILLSIRQAFKKWNASGKTRKQSIVIFKVNTVQLFLIIRIIHPCLPIHKVGDMK